MWANSGDHMCQLGRVPSAVVSKGRSRPSLSEAARLHERHTLILLSCCFRQGGGYSCPGWDDPSVDARIALNRLAVRFGAQAATHSASFLETHLDPGVVAGVNSSTNGIRTGKEVVFQTDYLFFMGAAILELICVLPITLTYWGWWKLGCVSAFNLQTVPRISGHANRTAYPA